ncbi:MAG TPA: hypothetical protein ENJ32_09775 [Crenotrichaceae bacterium]|nr:MAG: hypothetical protein AXA67_00040 [Methylothermaceae bacteria B42]HFD12739.1 hypothetical protein [Crenotrichaceae bacterium]
MAKNLLGRMFNKQTAIAEEPSADNQENNGQTDGLTGVARYLLNQQTATQSATSKAESQASQQPAERPATGVAKYLENANPPVLTGVAKYLVKQIIPEYQKRAEAAAKAAAPTGVAKYLAKVTAAAIEQQPAVPSSVEVYLQKLG